ncbi:MAG: hypothetical protein ABIT83_22080, partial [Massilia sp.]
MRQDQQGRQDQQRRHDQQRRQGQRQRRDRRALPQDAAGEVNARMSEIFQRAPAFMCVLRGPEYVF